LLWRFGLKPENEASVVFACVHAQNEAVLYCLARVSLPKFEVTC